jgi:hypothetical protein
MAGMEIFVTSVLIAIPISIVANLLTDPVQRKLDKRLKQQSARREANQAKFRIVVEELAADKAAFSNYLMVQVLRTTFFTALLGLFSGLAFAAGQLIVVTEVDEQAGNAFFVLGQALALMGSLLVLTVVRAALQTASAVREARKREIPRQGADEAT